MHSESFLYFENFLWRPMPGLSKKATNLQQKYFILVSLVSQNRKLPFLKKWSHTEILSIKLLFFSDQNVPLQKVVLWKKGNCFHCLLLIRQVKLTFHLLFMSFRVKICLSLNHFMPLISFDTPLETSGNQSFSDVFRGYRQRPVA